MTTKGRRPDPQVARGGYDLAHSMLKLVREELSSPAAQTLIAALNAELLHRYPEDGATHFRLDPQEVQGASGAFIVAYADGKAVGCGAVRRLSDGDAELKRMYVDPQRRGEGIGATLLGALESQARRLGATRLVLETGTRQQEALGLYRREGFTPIPHYGQYGEYREAPLSLCLAKPL